MHFTDGSKLIRMKSIFATLLLSFSVASTPAIAAGKQPAKPAKLSADQLTEKANAAIADNEAAIYAAANAGDLASVKIRTVGSEPWDSTIKGLANDIIRRIGISLEFRSTLENVGYSKLVEPGGLARHHNYAEAFDALSKAEVGLDTMQREMAEYLKEYEVKVLQNRYAARPENRELVTKGFASQRLQLRELGNSYRKLFALEREMVSFFQQHESAIRWEGDSWGFEDEEILAAGNKLLGQIAAAANEIK